MALPPFYKKVHHHPGNQPYSLRDAANEGALIVVCCGGCGRSARFLAADLVNLMDGHQPATKPPYPCATCGTSERVKVKLHYPSPADYGALDVRRPAGRKIMQLWRWAKFGDE